MTFCFKTLINQLFFYLAAVSNYEVTTFQVKGKRRPRETHIIVSTEFFL